MIYDGVPDCVISFYRKYNLFCKLPKLFVTLVREPEDFIVI